MPINFTLFIWLHFYIFWYIRFIIVLALKTLPIRRIYGHHVLFVLFPTGVILGSIFRDILWVKKW